MTTQNIRGPHGGQRVPGVSPRPQEAVSDFLDKDLTCYREGSRWTFSGGKILIDGQDASALLNNSVEIGFFMGIAEGIADYRKRVVAHAKEADQFSKFEAVVEALLGKILGKLKKFYDQKMSGMSWTLQNGQLILNGINIRSFLALYRIRKTDKAKKFLKGLRGKLVLLLENRNDSPDSERIHETLQDLYREIEVELATEEATRPSRPLLSHPPRSS